MEIKKEEFSFTKKAKMQSLIDDTDDYDRWTNHDWLSPEKGMAADLLVETKLEAKKSVEAIEWWVRNTNAEIYVMEIVTPDSCRNDQNGEDEIYGLIVTACDPKKSNNRRTEFHVAMTTFLYSEDVSAAMKRNFEYGIEELKKFFSEYKKDEGSVFICGETNDPFISVRGDKITTPPSAVCCGWADAAALRKEGCAFVINKCYNPEYDSTVATSSKTLGIFDIDIYCAKKIIGREKKPHRRCIGHFATGMKPETILAQSEKTNVISKSSINSLVKNYLLK